MIYFFRSTVVSQDYSSMMISTYNMVDQPIHNIAALWPELWDLHFCSVEYLVHLNAVLQLIDDMGCDTYECNETG